MVASNAVGQYLPDLAVALRGHSCTPRRMIYAARIPGESPLKRLCVLAQVVQFALNTRKRFAAEDPRSLRSQFTDILEMHCKWLPARAIFSRMCKK